MNEEKLKELLRSLVEDVYHGSPDFKKMKLKRLDEVFK